MNKAVSEATFWMPQGASTVASDVDALYYFIYYLSVVLFIGIVGSMTYFVFRYKRKSAEEIPHGPHHNTTLEVTWTVIPLILLLVVFVWGFKGYMRLAIAPGDALTVNVTAQQWQWSFTYENGVTNADDDRKENMPTNEAKGLPIVRVPVGRPVKFVMRSLDVLHSFWIPDFRVKHDIVPGQYSTIWFEAVAPGDYRVFCTEYCGDDHSMMMALVQAMPQADYDKWMNDRRKFVDDNSAPSDVGRRIFSGKGGCAGCHSTNGTPMAGPTFKALFGKKEEMADGSTVTVDEEYLRESIVKPRAKLVKGFGPVMPENFKDYSDVEITGLVEYIKTLK